MLKLMQSVDIFGVQFQLNTFKQPRFQTLIGSFLTIICMVIIVVFTFLFGQDFYFRKNPKVLSQTKTAENYTSFKLTPENLMIAWRINDQFSQKVNHTGIFYPYLRYTRIDKVKDTLNETFIPITECNEKNMKHPLFNKSYIAKDWYCMDWTQGDYQFGGYWDGNHIDYFMFLLSTCPLGSTTQEGCTDLDYLKNQLNSYESLFLEILYPDYTFNPDNLEQPLTLQIKNYLFRLSFNIRKLDRFFFKPVFMYDDQGWMLEDTKETSLYTSLRMETDLYFYSEADYNDHGNLGQYFYSGIFYDSRYYDHIRRSYMKIQDLGAIVGGFLKIILLFGTIISKILSTFIRDEMFANSFFEYNENQLIINDKTFTSNSGIGFNSTPLQNNFMKKDMLKNLEISPIMPVKKPTNENIKSLSNNNIPEKIEKIEKIKLLSQKTIKSPEKIPELSFGILFPLFQFICNKNKKSSNLNKKAHIYHFVTDYLKRKFDASCYLKMVQKVDRISNVVFNPLQNLAIEHLKKINIADPTELELFHVEEENEKILEKKYSQLVEYFSSKIKNNELEGMDAKLYRILDPNIKKLIDSDI